MIKETMRESGEKVLEITDPMDAPGLFVLASIDGGGDVSVAAESGRVKFLLFSEGACDPLSEKCVVGRIGFLDWYKEVIGYDPDADSGEQTPIIDLVSGFAERLMLDAY